MSKLKSDADDQDRFPVDDPGINTEVARLCELIQTGGVKGKRTEASRSLSRLVKYISTVRRVPLLLLENAVGGRKDRPTWPMARPWPWPNRAASPWGHLLTDMFSEK